MARNRYGRNQKRAHRARIAELEEELQKSVDLNRKMCASVNNVIAQADSIRRILRKINPHNPTEYPQELPTYHPLDIIRYDPIPTLLPYGTDGPQAAMASLRHIEIELSRLRYDVDQVVYEDDGSVWDQFQKAVTFTCSRYGQRQFMISDEAILLSEGLPLHITEQLVQDLSVSLYAACKARNQKSPQA